MLLLLTVPVSSPVSAALLLLQVLQQVHRKAPEPVARDCDVTNEHAKRFHVSEPICHPGRMSGMNSPPNHYFWAFKGRLCDKDKYCRNTLK